MTRKGVWELQGTAQQQQIISTALDRCSFPWAALTGGLQAKVGRDFIPVEWADLSVYASTLRSDHPHVHDETSDERADVIAARGRVLGLAWYSGKVSVDVSLASDPDLAGEVFISEGAHMIDFFLMSDVQRVGIWNALHDNPAQHLHAGDPVPDGTNLGHGHGWFDIGGYYSFVGEAFMGAIVRTYSTFAVSIPFDHPTSEAATYRVRATLTPYFAADGQVHDAHSRVPASGWYPTRADAEQSGVPLCPLCFPV